MIEPNILAFQNAALLDVLSDPVANGVTTIADLAKRFERDPDNFRKTLKRLQDDGILMDPPLSGLTDAGRDQLAAFKRAVHGVESRKAARAQAAGDRVDGDSPQEPARWPLDRFRRNPLNRAIDPEAVLGLADTIVGVGDILMPLVVSAPDADGFRTIWAGERRWMAATRLAQMDQLPEALLQGLPFTERAADKGEAAVITLIENGARADLTPWDDARQLRIAADATGLNATELARKIGRARDGDRGGVRDVQVKIKVAREATAEAVAAYEADPSAPGAWEALRDSVSKPKAPEIVTTKAQRLALAELFHKAGREVDRDVAILPAGHAAEGQRLAQYGLAILTRSDRFDTARVTKSGYVYLLAEKLLGSIESIRANLGYPEGHGVARYRTEWLNTTVKTPAPADDAETRALAGIEPIADDPYGRQSEWWQENNRNIRGACERLKPRQLLVLVETADKCARQPSADGHRWIAAECGESYPDATSSAQHLIQNCGFGFSSGGGRPRTVTIGDWAWEWLCDKGLIDASGANPATLQRLRLEALGAAGAARIKPGQYWTPWLNQNGTEADPLVVNGVRHPNAELAQEARYAAGIDKRPVANSGGERRAPEPSSLKQALDDLGHQCDAPDDDTVSGGPIAGAPAATAPPLASAPFQVHPAAIEALRLIAVERARQVEAEGWSPGHDDVENSEGELAFAAASYAFSSADADKGPIAWPAAWDQDGFKPTGTIRDLVKGGALIVAEIERRHRAGEA